MSGLRTERLKIASIRCAAPRDGAGSWPLHLPSVLTASQMESLVCGEKVLQGQLGHGSSRIHSHSQKKLIVLGPVASYWSHTGDYS
jgi:hypothetical protein